MKDWKGRAHVFGDNINTDIISPPAYMELPIEEAAKYAMSTIDTEFAGKVQEGDMFVGGNNLGSGSSRETSPLTLKVLGIKVVIAKFFARIFYRNCINIGLVAVECAQADQIAYGDELIVNLEEGYIENVTKKERYACSKIPEHIMALIEAGGMVEYLKKRKI